MGGGCRTTVEMVGVEQRNDCRVVDGDRVGGRPRPDPGACLVGGATAPAEMVRGGRTEMVITISNLFGTEEFRQILLCSGLDAVSTVKSFYPPVRPSIPSTRLARS